MTKRQTWALAIGAIVLLLFHLFGWNILPKEECSIIGTRYQCLLTSGCYWEEDFIHDGIGPTGAYYCEDEQ